MSATEPAPLRVLELFAGLGGMRLALAYAGLEPEAFVAVEIADQALQTYAHNFGTGDLVRRDLCGLNAAWFEKQQCQIWTMSPPCQPYSRQGKVRDTEDARAKPLLHIIDVLREVKTPPEVIVLENVQNFEVSESCRRLLEVLESRGYHWRSFLLSPQQFGFPNSRQRFYLVAKQRRWPFAASLPEAEPAPVPEAQAQPLAHLPCCAEAAPGAPASGDGARGICAVCGASALASSASSCAYPESPISAFLEEEESDACASEGRWLVSEELMRKGSARCFDVVKEACCHSLCFTKAYGRYVDGTGSVLELPRRVAEPSGEEYAMRDFYGRLRYFAPGEVARLLGFKLRGAAEPACGGGCLPSCGSHGREGAARGPCRCPPFGLPPSASPEEARGLWALLGNSLNPQVVALVCFACGVQEIAGARV